MPDGRFLSKTVAHDLELNSVSLEADYLFARCIPWLDREGRMAGHPNQVKAMAVPLRPELTPAVVDRCLTELAAAGLVAWYEVEGRPVLEFPGFEKHQKGLRKNREAESRLPSPRVQAAQRLTGLLRTSSGPAPDQLRPSEVKGSEVKLSEVKGEASRAREAEAGDAGRDAGSSPSGSADADPWSGLDTITADSIRGLYGSPGREGTDEAVWRGANGVDRERVLKTALLRWQSEGHPKFHARLFRKILLSVIEEQAGRGDSSIWED